MNGHKEGLQANEGKKSFRKLSKHNSVNIFIVVYPVVEQEELETCFAKWENLKWMEKTTSRWKNRLSDKCLSLNLIDDVKQEARNASDKKKFTASC